MKRKIVVLLIMIMLVVSFAECSVIDPAIVFSTRANEIDLYLLVDSNNTIDWGDNQVSSVSESGKYSHVYQDNRLHEIKIIQDNVLALICSEQQITTLDVTNATRLEDLECGNNMLTELDLTQNKKLQILDCKNNEIQEIDVRNSPNLFLLNCSQKLLKTLKVCELPDERILLDYGGIAEYIDRMILVDEKTKIITEKKKNTQSISPVEPEIESKNESLRDIVGTKYEEAVNGLVNKEIFSGYPDGTFLPEKSITRAEIVTVVTKLNAMELLTDFELAFNDVTTHWAKAYICTLATKGFVSGYGNGEFRPNNNVTYAEVAAMVLNSLGYKDEVSSMNIGWPNNYVEKSRELGLYKDITVTNPNDKMTRGEVAIFVYNVMNSGLVD